MGWLAERRCRRKGHDWLLNHPGSEFIPTVDVCLRCGATQTALPWGWCLGDHALAEHYDAEGNLVEHPTCAVPA